MKYFIYLLLLSIYVYIPSNDNNKRIYTRIRSCFLFVTVYLLRFKRKYGNSMGIHLSDHIFDLNILLTAASSSHGSCNCTRDVYQSNGGVGTRWRCATAARDKWHAKHRRSTDFRYVFSSFVASLMPLSRARLYPRVEENRKCYSIARFAKIASTDLDHRIGI